MTCEDEIFKKKSSSRVKTIYLNNDENDKARAHAYAKYTQIIR